MLKLPRRERELPGLAPAGLTFAVVHELTREVDSTHVSRAEAVKRAGELNRGPGTWAVGLTSHDDERAPADRPTIPITVRQHTLSPLCACSRGPADRCRVSGQLPTARDWKCYWCLQDEVA